MDIFTASGLALLEMIFVFVTLMLLHGLRKLIGNASFYISVGLLIVFTHIISTAGLEVKIDIWGGNFQVSAVSLFLPSLAAMLVIYVSEGTLAMQRMLIGIIASLGFYTYLSAITRVQCNWDGFAITKGPTADSVEYLLLVSQKSMAGTTLSLIIDMFLLPIFFQRLRNMQCRLFFCCLGALVFTQLADAFLVASFTYWGQSAWIDYITSALTIRSVAVLILSVLATIYLFRIEKEKPGESRRALDIVFAFFGGYSKARELQVHINEWEDRYRMVVESASEVILMLDKKGRIIDANVAACRIMGFAMKPHLIGKYFPSIFFDAEDKPLMWNRNYMALEQHDGVIADSRHIECHAVGGDGQKVELSVTISPIDFENVKMFVVVGRNMTEHNRMHREKEELTMQLAHAQRLESIGQLAGGVAHDFNNFIHSIIGHLDVIKYIHKVQDPQVIKHVDKVIDISEQAAKLTRQLLGFARKGKYIQRELDLTDLLEKSIELFIPRGHKDVDVELTLPRHKTMVFGDMVQLQQVMLNLLLNARDAVAAAPERDSIIKVYTAKANKLKIKLIPPRELGDASKLHLADFHCIVVEDNGEGIDKDTMERIFEPFFTTKDPGKGTGMGLSMVYGTIVNHGGWVQVESDLGKGTRFYIFLPAITGGDKQTT
ncbi:MAG: PAS domain S-box protein [Victivallales bacterium]|nr:PAS domain S-box protein [Victivallales bacterium]